MKVCVTFHNDVFTPWPATSIIHPLETLLEVGHEVVVISWDKGRNIKPRDATLPVKRETVNVPVTGGMSYYAFSRALAQRLEEHNPDVILAFDLEVLKGSADAANKMDIPLLFFAREDWPAMVRRNGDLKSIARSALFSRMEKSVCKSSVSHAYAVNYERGKKYIDWGVPYSTIYTTRSMKELPEPEEKHDKYSIALAGSMHEINALPAILRAIKSVDCDLYLIGGKKERMPEIRRLVEKAGVSDKVVITGRLDSDDYYRELSKCHVGLTLPHNTDLNKYFGITVKTWDYMSMGMPIVASNFPALRRVVEDNRIGMVIDPTSEEAIRDAIVELKEHTDTMGMKARELFEEKYSWEKQKEDLKKSHWIFRGEDVYTLPGVSAGSDK